MNLEEHMWMRAYSHIHNKYVKIINVRPDSRGELIYDAEGPDCESRHMFRKCELGNIQWIPYGSSER